MGNFSVTHDGAVAVVTLDDPRVGNAIDAETATALAARFDALSLDPEGTRAVLIRGEGRHFCTGAVLRPGSAGERPPNGHMVRLLTAGHHRLIRSVYDCRLPVVAAVQGAARGVGLHLALAADLVIGAADATFAEPFTERGFSVDSGGSWLLPQRIGMARAKRLLYTAEAIDAATALDWGLIDEVVEPTELEVAARRMTETLASRPTQALAATKRLLHDHAVADLDQALHAEAMAVELTIRSNDFKEGMAAFAEGRAPRFTGS